MNEVVTILTSASGHSLVKSFRGPDLTKQNFSIGNSFQVVEEQVSDLKSLSNVLQRLENEPTNTIIRGSLGFVRVNLLETGGSISVPHDD